MRNTCKPMAVSFQCMTKSTTIKKIIIILKNLKKKWKCHRKVTVFHPWPEGPTEAASTVSTLKEGPGYRRQTAMGLPKSPNSDPAAMAPWPLSLQRNLGRSCQARFEPVMNHSLGVSPSWGKAGAGGTLSLKKEEETGEQLQVFCKYYHIFCLSSLAIIFSSLDGCNLFYPNS